MSGKPHILIADTIAPNGITLLQDHPDVTVTVCPGLSPAALRQEIPRYQGVIVRSD